MDRTHAPAHRPPWYRRRVIVDPRLQLGLAAYWGTFCTVVMLALAFGLFAPLIHRIQGEVEAAAASELATVMLYMHAHFWPVACGCIAVAILGSILQSHRIAGPLVRVRRYLDLIAAGIVPPPLRTRRSDYLHAEVAALNRATAALAERIDRLQRAEAGLGAALAEGTAALADGRADEAARALAQAAACASELHRELGTLRREGDRPAPALAAPTPVATVVAV